MRFILASSNQQLCVFTAQGCTDIADRVGCEHIEALSSISGGVQLWVTPSLRGCRTLNGPATRLLFALTGFTAVEVPLLRGDVVITSSDNAGCAAGLTDADLDQLRAVIAGIRRRDDTILTRRLRRARNQDLRVRQHSASADPWALLHARPPGWRRALGLG